MILNLKGRRLRSSLSAKNNNGKLLQKEQALRARRGLTLHSGVIYTVMKWEK